MKGGNAVRVSLKAARVNKNLSQEDVAVALNVTRKTVGAWENGKSMPKVDKIDPLCAILGVNYDDIQWKV
jgi:transcriptional regulator with XRE-family HTH domain